MRALLAVSLAFAAASASPANPLSCDLGQYQPGSGLTAAIERDLLVVTWDGERGAELRVKHALDRSQPVIRELAVRHGGGWKILGRDLIPEYQVTSGVRRMSNQQAQPLRQLGVEITPQVIEKEKWYAFWDAPLVVPGVREGQTPDQARNLGLPRRADEIRRASASFATSSCSVKTEGGRIEVTFPGLSMGIFEGSLRYTAYRGSSLLRMEAVAKTNESSVAYKYQAGLKGLSTTLTPRVVWRDQGGDAQDYEFGGAAHESPVPVKARNRLLIAEGAAGSIAAFPPPHTFFWAREVETNLGYVWYRKDGATGFSIGVRQADGEEEREYAENFALYNAPPGTWQRMAAYFYVTTDAAEPTRQAALAYTHGDTYKAVPGYKTLVNHFHIRFTERLRAQGSLDAQTPDLIAMKALGVNIVGLSDFHGDLRGTDPGAGRFADQRDYAEGTRRASDKDFLVTPWEEPSAYFGGHTNHMFPRNVYWTKVRQAGQPFTETDPVYGKVYHTGTAADVQQLLDAENGYWFHAHPRTKGTTGYPDAIFDKPWAKSDRYLGVAFKPGMGMDLSETRLCEYRCFDAIDTMNNRYAGSGLRPKLLIADIDTYRKGPEDDLYPSFPMNYVKLDRVPGPDEDWTPILKALRDGDFFVSTGEVLLKNYSVEGSTNRRTIVADAEWTFPLEFAEIVWGDGQKVDRQIIPLTDLPPMGSKRFALPFEATGRKWVRFAIWDSAGNGAFVQPVWLDTRPATSAAR